MRLRRAVKSKSSPKKASKGTDSESKRAPGLIRFWAGGFLGVSLVVLLAVLAGLVASMGRDESHRMSKLEVCSVLLAGDLGSRAAVLRERLSGLSGDPQLQGFLRSSDPKGLADGEALLGRFFPAASRTRLLPPGSSSDTSDQAEPLGYAGLDLAHQAEAERQVTRLEVHRPGQPDANFAIAGPVLDWKGESVLGVVFIALPMSLLPSTQDVGSECGQVLFQQLVGDQVAMIGPQPAGPVPDREPDQVADVPDTRLRAVGWLADSVDLDGGPIWLAGVLLLVTLVCIAAVMWLAHRLSTQALAADRAGILSLVEDALSRRRARSQRWRLAETQSLADAVGRLLRGSGPGVGATSPETSGLSPAAPTTEQKVPADGSPAVATAEKGLAKSSDEVPAQIFRGYDIRGIVDRDLTADLARDIGRAVGTEAINSGNRRVYVARDTRQSGTALSAALTEGLRGSGCDVVDLGIAPTPVLYFATRSQGELSGVEVTASHNPEEYNGFKVVIAGNDLEGDGIGALRERILRGDFAEGKGGYQEVDLIPDYVAQVETDVAVARTLKVVIDCGNATASIVAPDLYRALGCELVAMNCDPEAGFPGGRVPDPTLVQCLEALRSRVVAEEADIGLAFDGDGDRLGVVDSSGKIIWADRLLMLLAADVLSRHPGADVVYDVKSSHHLATEILRNGGRPVMWKSGHSPLKAKLRETGAPLAGEWSGHIMFEERWFGFDDALYAGARLLEVLALDPRPSAEVFAELPDALGTPEMFLRLPEGEAPRMMEEILAHADRFSAMETQTIDGLRVGFDKGWGLVRASNTQPALVFRFEGDDEEALEKIKGLFRGLMEDAFPDLQLPL